MADLRRQPPLVAMLGGGTWGGAGSMRCLFLSCIESASSSSAFSSSNHSAGQALLLDDRDGLGDGLHLLVVLAPMVARPGEVVDQLLPALFLADPTAAVLRAIPRRLGALVCARALRHIPARVGRHG